MANSTPQLNFPLRLGVNGFLTNEQDSQEDIESCVRVIITTPTGWLEGAQDFGVPDLTFGTSEEVLQSMVDAVNEFEPRVLTGYQSNYEQTDQLIQKVHLQLKEATN